jgi:hypothetical protein
LANYLKYIIAIYTIVLVAVPFGYSFVNIYRDYPETVVLVAVILCITILVSPFFITIFALLMGRRWAVYVLGLCYIVQIPGIIIDDKSFMLAISLFQFAINFKLTFLQAYDVNVTLVIDVLPLIIASLLFVYRTRLDSRI